MKKLIFVLLGVIALVSNSCDDKSGKYATQLFTYSQMESAFTDCLSIAIDYAVECLCPEDELDYALGYGFYEYEDESYRIYLPLAARGIVDSLTAHGQGALIDTMVLHINRAAEASGSAITNAFSSALDGLTYVNHQSYMNTSTSDALTQYFKTQCGVQISQSLLAPVQVKLNEKGVMTEWNQILAIYYTYNPQPVSIDLNSYVTNQIVDAVFSEMGVAEGYIRSDDSWQTTDILALIFGMDDYE
jgi:hypothetical protein